MVEQAAVNRKVVGSNPTRGACYNLRNYHRGKSVGMAKDHKEWFRQADYDMGAAHTLFDGGRYIYAVFMCHLAIEKALKGLYFNKHQKQAPKTHNLLRIADQSRAAYAQQGKTVYAA